jgi:hypothetical protein
LHRVVISPPIKPKPKKIYILAIYLSILVRIIVDTIKSFRQYSFIWNVICFASLLILIIFGALSISILLAQSNNSIVVDPDRIEIVASIDKTNDIQRTLYISSNGKNISKVTSYINDLTEAGKEQTIPSSHLIITPTSFSLTKGKLENLNLNINAANAKPGIYSGKILLVGNEIQTVAIPLNLTIHNTPILAMVLISAGVLTNFILRIIRWKVDEKDTALGNLEDAEETAYQIENSGNTENDNYVRGLEFLSHAVDEFNKESSKDAIRAKQLFVAASLSLSPPNTGDKNNHIHIASVTPELSKNKNLTLSSIEQIKGPTTVREISSSISELKRSEYIVYIGLSLILLLIILQVWNQFYPQLAQFGTSGMTYVAAFLFGYAAQALIGEAFEFVKRSRMFK